MAKYYNSDDNALFSLIFSVLLLVVIIVAAYFFNTMSCPARWPDNEAKYGVVTGCMVNWGGTWVPEDRVRVVE